MKNLYTYSMVLLFTFAQFMSSCDSGDPLPADEAEKVKALLKASSWAMKTVTVDGVDKTTLYNGLTLSFTDTNFTTVNGGSIWPATGTWSFVDQTGKQITRNDNVVLNIEEVSETILNLKFTWSKSTFGSGRISSVSGVHVFSFGK